MDHVVLIQSRGGGAGGMERRGRELWGRGEWWGEGKERGWESSRSKWDTDMCLKPVLPFPPITSFYFKPTLTMFPSWHCVNLRLTCPSSLSLIPPLSLSVITLSQTLCESTPGHSWPLLYSAAPRTQSPAFSTPVPTNGHVLSINAYFHGNPAACREGQRKVWDFLLETKSCVCVGWGLDVGVGLHRLDREWPQGERTHTNTRLDKLKDNAPQV